MGKPKNNRNGIIDIYRMIMAIIIMIFHSYHLFAIKDYPFLYGRIYVEAFFALSGYFAVHYFEKNRLSMCAGGRKLSVKLLER